MDRSALRASRGGPGAPGRSRAGSRAGSRWRPAGWVAVVALAAALVLGAGAPARAHATLVDSDPAEGAVLEAAPERIRLTFDEAVLGVPDGVQVVDARGGAVGSEAEVNGQELDVTLTDEVGEGTLVVVWRVVSEDGHPISGSLSFSVGAPSATVERPPAASSGAPEAPRGLSLVRWTGYLGLLLAVGLVAFTVLLLPTTAVADRSRGRLLTVLRLSGAIAVVAWTAALPLAAVYQLGGGASSLTEASTWAALATAEYVVTATVAVGVALAVGLAGRRPPARPPSRRRGLAAVAAGAAAVCAPALTGHTRAATPEALAVGVDMLHLVAGSVWLGGLVALALVLPDLAARGQEGAEVLTRFSGVAAGILAALVVSGSILTWRILGSWSALLGSGYGRLLMVKLAVVLVAVAIAAWNRYALLGRLQQAVRRRDRRAGARPVVRAAGAEAAVLVAVLLVTGLLVDRSPEAEASAPAAAETRPVVRTATLGEVEVRATMSPLVAGPTTVTIEMQDPAGEPFEGFEAPRARLATDRFDLGAVRVRSVAPGTYAAEVVLPAAGTWQLQVSLRVTEFENPVATLEFPVGG